MRNVLVICGEKDQRFFLITILGRSDINFRMETSLKDVLQVIVKSPPGLLIIKESAGTELGQQLDELSRGFPVVPFPVAVLGGRESHEPLPDFVKKVIPADAGVAVFNNEVAELLNLPSRRSARFPIRIGVDLAAPGLSAIANTVNISSTGMLIESTKLLFPGRAYKFRFMAMARLADLPAITVRIVREEKAGAVSAGTHCYAAEFVDIPPDKMDKVIEKLLA